MKRIKNLTHQTKIFLAVVVIFFLLVPPVIHFSLQPLRDHVAETSARHSSNMQAIAALPAGGATAGALDAAVRQITAEEQEASRNSFIRAEKITFISILAGGLFTAFFTTYLIIRRLVNPLISLCSQIREDVRIDVKGGPEFLEIGTAFNRRLELLQEKDRQLLQAQQMELAGLMASGMVHEFNTVLTIVRGFTEHLQRQEVGEECRRITGHIVKAVDRGYHLTRALRPFQREGLIKPEPVELNRLVVEVQEEQEKVIGHCTSLQADASPEPLWVMGDRYFLQQVLINILNNARDAMPGGGVIRIVNTMESLDEPSLRGYDWTSPGRYGRISITDNGLGMDEATARRIFQPFFTTKAVGEGTGLGLTMAYGIIREHKGFISVRSEAAQGTEVSIFLPATCSPSANPPC